MIRINLLQPRWRSQLKRWYVNGGPTKWFWMRQKVFPSVGGILTVCNEEINNWGTSFDPVGFVRAHDTVKSSLGKARQREEEK